MTSTLSTTRRYWKSKHRSLRQGVGTFTILTVQVVLMFWSFVDRKSKGCAEARFVYVLFLKVMFFAWMHKKREERKCTSAEDWLIYNHVTRARHAPPWFDSQLVLFATRVNLQRGKRGVQYSSNFIHIDTIEMCIKRKERRINAVGESFCHECLWKQT